MIAGITCYVKDRDCRSNESRVSGGLSRPPVHKSTTSLSPGKARPLHAVVREREGRCWVLFLAFEVGDDVERTRSVCIMQDHNRDPTVEDRSCMVPVYQGVDPSGFEGYSQEVGVAQILSAENFLHLARYPRAA